MTIKIEKGIELPKPNRDKVKYPLQIMDVEDSFAVKIADIPSGRYLRHYVCVFGKDNNKKFAVRKEGDDALRVFRVE